MPNWGYSIISETLDPEKTAKASGREIKVSHKHAREVCKAVKGMTLANAKKIPARRYGQEKSCSFHAI